MGCPITPVFKEGQRALDIRGQIVRLQNLVDPGTICRAYDVDTEDLELLAMIEDELTEDKPTEESPGG